MKYSRVIVNSKGHDFNKKEGIVINCLNNGLYEVIVDKTSAFFKKNELITKKDKLEVRTLRLPKLNGLENITVVSTILKIQEELGEFCQLYGKDSGLNGEEKTKDKNVIIENLAKELMDISQTCISMAYVLEEQYDIDMEKVNDQHIRKLLTKGYLK